MTNLTFKNETFKIPTLFNLNSSEYLSTRKARFLRVLQGKSQKYKRYTKSPLRYGGGKSLAVGLIIEHFPNDIKRVISPFIGGGSVEVASFLELGLEVRAFDIFDILVNFWQVLLRDSNALCASLEALNPTQETYNAIKAELKAHYKNETKLDSLTLARDYYFNFNLSYGPGFLGWMSKIYADLARYEKMCQKLRDLGREMAESNANFGANLSANLDSSANSSQTARFSVECESFEVPFSRYPNDFFYCDPPYFLEGDSKMFRGIYPMRNFPIHHNGFQHELLRDLLHAHKGRFVLSYNDCKWVREAYKDFKILAPKWQYTMGQGETRIGKNRIERGDSDNIKQSHELLIIKE